MDDILTNPYSDVIIRKWGDSSWNNIDSTYLGDNMIEGDMGHNSSSTYAHGSNICSY